MTAWLRNRGVHCSVYWTVLPGNNELRVFLETKEWAYIASDGHAEVCSGRCQEANTVLEMKHAATAGLREFFQQTLKKLGEEL